MSQNDKRILITGISGFIGSYLARSLLNKGMEVYGLLRRRADGLVPHNLQRLSIADKLHFIEGDLENIASMGNLLSEIDPDTVYHLGAQSFIPRSFEAPLETMNSNCIGTANLFETIRCNDLDPKIIFSGSSEEYGLVFSSMDQYEQAIANHGAIFPEPQEIPEVPIAETNPLRPMSPYAISKVCGDYLARTYWHSYGLKAVVSRAFNTEGAGRGIMFVTSAITSQVSKFKSGELKSLTIGNVNAFRDWSHVEDVINGYQLIADKGRYGDVYNQGSMRTNSVMSYILLSLAEAGYYTNKIEALKGGKAVVNPLDIDRSPIFGISFERTRIDNLMLNGDLVFSPEDGGIIAHAGSERIKIFFDPKKFRQAENPITLSDTKKIRHLGFEAKHKLEDIIRDQLNYHASGNGQKGDG
jgi:GDPmannose 4,6-dehydratase